MAVYTLLTDEEANSFLGAYDIGDFQSLVPISSGIENTNYFLTTSKNKYVFTIFEKRINPEELPFFIDLKKHLSQNGISCPKPIEDKAGNALKIIKTKYACIASFLPGQSPIKPKPSDAFQLGKALANIHVCSRDFKQGRENDLGISGMQRLAGQINGQADKVKRGLAKTIENEILFLSNRWPLGLPKGIIHGDLFPDNTLFQGEDLTGLIDFYFACKDFLSYDLAVTINAWCFDDNNLFIAENSKALVNGYHSVRPLTQEEQEYLPILCRAAALRFLLTRTYDWLNPTDSIITQPKDPNDFEKRLVFHQQVKDFSHYV